MGNRKIGRNAGSGRFMTVKAAQQQKATAIVQTIRVPAPKKKGK